MKRIFGCLESPERVILGLGRRRLLNWVTDKTYLETIYKLRFGKHINWEDPKTFNEKLQWLKLYDRNPLYTTLVDKYAVKEHVASIIGSEYIIPTIGSWNNAKDIDFDALPDRFVLKCNHDSGGILICKDKRKLDYDSTRRKLNRCLRHNGYWYGREWPYKNVKPRIIAEKYMKDTQTSELRDYKFFCFNGKVKCFKIDFDRFVYHRANYFDTNGTLLPFGELICPPDFDRTIDMPHNLQLMIKFSEILSKGIPFVRVDFYEVDGKVYFGEMTFYPASGFGVFTDGEWDYKLGEWITLPDKN
jgi:hypothetical protein